MEVERGAVARLNRVAGAIVDCDIDLARFIRVGNGQAHERFSHALAVHGEPAGEACPFHPLRSLARRRVRSRQSRSLRPRCSLTQSIHAALTACGSTRSSHNSISSLTSMK